MKDIELFNQFFWKINLSFCVDIYFFSWCMYWIIAYFYILDIIYIKDKISVTLLHVDANYANWDFFNIFFVNIQSFEFKQLFIFLIL